MRIRTKLASAFSIFALGYLVVFWTFLATSSAVSAVWNVRLTSEQLVSSWAEVSRTGSEIAFSQDTDSARSELMRLSANFEAELSRFLTRLPAILDKTVSVEEFSGPLSRTWDLVSRQLQKINTEAGAYLAEGEKTSIVQAAFAVTPDRNAVSVLASIREFNTTQSMLSILFLDLRHQLDTETIRRERYYERASLVFIAVLSIGAIALAFLLAFGIAHQIDGVKASFSALSRGDFSHPFQWEKRDEFGDLSMSAKNLLGLLKLRLDGTSTVFRAIVSPPAENEVEVVRRTLAQALRATDSHGAALYPPLAEDDTPLMTAGEYTEDVFLEKGPEPVERDLKRLRSGEGERRIVRKGDGESGGRPFMAYSVGSGMHGFGVLVVTRRAGSAPYTDLDVVFASQLADLAGLAMENAAANREVVEMKVMEKEMELASRLQSDMKPASLPRIPGFSIASSSVSARELGGDYVEFIRCGKERYSLILSDASGKGISAALIMASLRTLLRVFGSHMTTAGKTLSVLNVGLCRCIESGTFITAAVVSVEARSREVTISGAGHVEVLVYRASSRSVDTIESEGMPLGISRDAVFPERTVTLHSGDVVLLVSDGVTETRSAAGDFFGIDGLKNFFLEYGQKRADELLAALEKTLDAFSGNAALSDDRSIAILRAV